ncbi:MAG TPA: hypothetical protein VFS80_16495 [Burkholderiales bacterium]|nr:hypothetical protein [Burkholderiales bacterium]
MLHEFLTSNRNELIKRCRRAAGARIEPSLSAETIDSGVPLFLQQLTGILRKEQHTDDRPPEGKSAVLLGGDGRSDIGRTAALQGAEFMRLGYNLDQVVHGYGDVCQAITTLAVEQTAPISADEFRTLNRCLDNAIADAVSAFSGAGQVSRVAQAETLSERLSAYADEQRRLVDIAVHSYDAIKTGSVGMAGATGALLLHTLEELRSLPERKLPEIRLRDPATGLAPKLNS